MNAHHVSYLAYPMNGVEAMVATSARSFPRHTHDQFGIGLVVDGRHKSWSARGQVEAGPGQFICVNPGEVHDGHPLAGGQRSWRMLYLEPQVMADLEYDVIAGGRAEFEFTAPVFDQPKLHRHFHDAFRLAGRSSAAERNVDAEEALLTLFACLAGQRRRMHTGRNAARAEVFRAKQLIDSSPEAPWSLECLAHRVGLSRFQLIRGFVRITGLAPHAYLVQRRLEMARLLIRGGLGLADVAARSGFSDQSHLTRKFSRQFGVPPHRYRLATR